jgi:hypothetical protein
MNKTQLSPADKKDIINEVKKDSEAMICEAIEGLKTAVKEDNKTFYEDLKALFVDNQIDNGKFKQYTMLKFNEIDKRLDRYESPAYLHLTKHGWKYMLSMFSVWIYFILRNLINGKI